MPLILGEHKTNQANAIMDEKNFAKQREKNIRSVSIPWSQRELAPPPSPSVDSYADPLLKGSSCAQGKISRHTERAVHLEGFQQKKRNKYACTLYNKSTGKPVGFC